MNEYPLITLGIPVYNAAELIEHTLLSALNQTYPNIEYLLIDDKGNSMDIVRRVVAEHPKRDAVHIIDQVVNQGIGAARNAIIENAKGKYLFTMDCDDLITPNCIEVLYVRMKEHPVNFVAASFIRVDMEGVQYPGFQYADTLIGGENYPVAQYRYGQGKEIFVASWNKLYQLEFLNKYHIRCKSGHFNEDPWFTYQVVMNASSCRLIPDCTLHYTYNPYSVSGISAVNGYSEKIARQYVDIQKLKVEYIRSLSGEELYKSLLIDIMVMSAYHAYRIGASDLLHEALRKELQIHLLTPSFSDPTGKARKLSSFKYRILYTFFKLPIEVKRLLINLSVCVRFKDRIKHWIHLK